MKKKLINFLRSFEKRENIHGIGKIEVIGNRNSNLNSSGRLSLRAELDGVKVKIYEANNFQHANLIKEISEVKKDIFPEVINIEGNWVFSKWIEG